MPRPSREPSEAEARQTAERARRAVDAARRGSDVPRPEAVMLPRKPIPLAVRLAAWDRFWSPLIAEVAEELARRGAAPSPPTGQPDADPPASPHGADAHGHPASTAPLSPSRR